MWLPVLFLKVTSLVLLGLASALLLTALFTPNWVVYSTLWGTYYEDLMKSCIDSTCLSLNRDWVYNTFVIGVLATAGGYSAILLIVFLLLHIFKKNNFLSKKFNQTIVMPVVCTLIAMSVYTGYYTNGVLIEERGFSFWLAWASFPISLLAVFATLCHTILQEIEEEHEIISNAVPKI